jgi:hypothetical protein
MTRKAVAAAGLAMLVGALGAGAALADTVPSNPADPRTPVTVAADSLPTVQVDGVVWQQLVIGDTVYAAGRFTSARPAGAPPGVDEVGRSNLLAYDLTTGQLVKGFRADLNAQARTLAKSPDGTRLYVGGDFTTVNGVGRGHVAALDPSSGRLLDGFTPTASGEVMALLATPDTVYLGGSFSAINGYGRTRIGAVSAATGSLRGFKAGVTGGSVHAMLLSPDGTKLVVGGSFTTLNGSNNPGYGLGALNPGTGASLPFNVNRTIRNGGLESAILSLAGDATRIYGSGYVFGPGGNLEGVFAANWADTNLQWIEDCHGDTYGVYPSANAVYIAGHPHFCGNVGGFPETVPRTHHRALAFSKATTGTVKTNTTGRYFNFGGQPAPSLLHWFPDINLGTYTGQYQGPWTVTGADGYLLYGGEFTQVNGTPQQGLTRFATSDIAPNRQGPRASGTDFQPIAAETPPGTVTVNWPANWDRDNANLAYTVYQDEVPVRTLTVASTLWNRPTLSHTITGVPAGTHAYKVSVTDPLGNAVTSPTVPNESRPAVIARSPATGATGVSVGTTTTPTPMTATFSEPVSDLPTTATATANFTLTQGTSPVASTVVYDPATLVARLVPDAPLLADRTYTLTLDSAITSAAGGPLAAESWSFTTGPCPTVTATNPFAGYTGVSIGTTTARTRLTATFSEAVSGLPTTAAATANYTLKQGTTVVKSKVVYSPTTRVATLTPDAPLVADRTYSLTLSSAIKDLAGNPLAAKTWTFITGPRPTVTARTPASGAVGVSRTANIYATFSEAVTGIPTTAAATSNFTIRRTSTGALVAAAASYSATIRVAVLNPSSTLLGNTQYTVTLTSGIKDRAGNLLKTLQWTFTTRAT